MSTASTASAGGATSLRRGAVAGEPALVGALALRERKRILDAVSLLTVAVVVGALAGLWFLRVLEIDLAASAWTAFAYAAAYLLAAALTDRLQGARGLRVSIQVLQLTLVLFLAALWHLTGGVDNPMFLLAFIIPVSAGGMVMSRGQPFVTALLSIALVGAVALAESPDLRWYLEGLGLPAARLASWLPEELPGRVRPFPGLETEPAYVAVQLALFAVMQLVAAFLAGSLTTVLLRLAARLRSSVESLEEAQGLFQAVLHAKPEPGLVIYADTTQVVHASQSLLKRMLLEPDDLIGKGLFELARFAEPERVRRLLDDREGGEAPFCVYHVGPETRIANVAVYPLEHQGTRYAYVDFEDLTEQYYLGAAFDALDSPMLVLSADRRLLYANRAADDLVGPVHFGMDVDPLLAFPGMPRDWWTRATRPAHQPRVEVHGQPFRAAAVETPLPGEALPAYVLTLRSLAEEESLFEQAVRDPLTHLYNRRFLDLTLPRQLAAVRRGARASLAFLDLDHFKPINDQLGHAAGDAALLTFVRVVQAELRATDVFVRAGGDEFAVLFPDATPRDAAHVIDRIYERLAHTPLEWEGHTRKLGFSAGMVSCRPEEEADALLARVDQLMYDAKKSGKGKCTYRD